MTSTNSKISDFWINGLLCAPCTPFTSNGDLNLSLIDRYVQHLVDFGILNAFVTGTTGEGNSMTVAERKLVAEAWIAAGRDRLSVIMIHIGAGNLRDSQELARHAQEAGADAIACVGPTYHKPDALSEYVHYMQQVAAAAPDLPFYLYDIDFVTGIGFSAVEFFDAALPVIPTLRGVKHTSPSLPSMLTIVARHGRRVQVLSGSDELYLATLAIGLGENIGQSFLGRVLIRMKQAFDSGDLATARVEQDVHLFAYESETFNTNSGQRLYLACSYEQFWHYYSRLPLKLRHHYEVIPEDTVCRLYLDLEFEYKFNESKDSARMTDVCLKYVCAWLFRLYDIICSAKDILLLDASTDTKFSKHAIFHVPGAAFRNNAAVGCFVRRIHNKLLSFIGQRTESLTDCSGSSTGFGFVKSPNSESCRKSDVAGIDTNLGFSEPTHSDDIGDPDSELKWLATVGICKDDLASLVVKHRNGSTTYLYDLGVYTRNRNFRLLGSTKLGKPNGELVVSADNRFDVSLKEESCKDCYLKNDQLFYNSLVCSVQFSDQLKILDFDEMPHCTTCLKDYSAWPSATSSKDRSEGYAQSPYPAVDDCITSFVQSYGGCKRGRIWRWACFNTDGCVLVYDIVQNRWCANIGREHRSNNIYIVVDLSRGVYYQKCHDPDCRNAKFKSQDYQLPPGVFPVINTLMDDGDDVPDVDLLKAAISVEKSIATNDCNSVDGASDEELVQAAISAESDVR